jgi:hypothetical protein
VQDFNLSKFKDSDHDVVNGLLENIFPDCRLDTAPRDRQTDFGNLTELFQQHMSDNKLERNSALEQKCYQLYEISQVKMGCLVVGET